LSFSAACDYGAAPEQNSSKAQQESAEVKTPAGGGSNTTNKRSVPDQPPAKENIEQGSAVPPAPNDQTRPHPQPQDSQPQQPSQQPKSSS